MNPKYPQLIDRIQSTFIDTLVIVVLMFLWATILERIPDPPDWLRMTMFFVIWGAYEPICTSCGFTLGNYIKGLRVRRYSNPEKKINIFQALIRYVFKIALGWVSFLTISSNPERRAIHDIVCGSVMIKL
jgi:uncharacterized RDD family membrane protein YckC